MAKLHAACCLQEVKREDYEETPQGVLDTLHELQQQLTAVADEKRKREKAAMSTIGNLKEKMIRIEEENLKLSDQLDLTQESLKGVLAIYINSFI